MSEEILKALTQLFAIVTKQDSGVSEKEREYVINFFRTELDQDSVTTYLEQYDLQSDYGKASDTEERKATTVQVKESIRILGICKKINKTLTQKQKVIVLIKLIELIVIDSNFTPQRIQIINTVASVFNIDAEEYKLIEAFVETTEPRSLQFHEILLASSDTVVEIGRQYKHIHAHMEGILAFMRVKSVDLFFVKYIGADTIMLNSFSMNPGHVYLFSQGSTVKTPAGNAIYYSDLLADFTEEIKTTRLSFHASIETLRFENGTTGLYDIQISEGPGKLIGIMGASGAGKTTLVNVLAGLVKPTSGKIQINGLDIFSERHRLKGVIGFVAQDDLLIEELTVYQNLYYNARLCFAHLAHDQLHQRVMHVLENLGLDQRKDLRVGTLLDKTISGGQRKRLNIALELIREPAVLFLDEPTSGLSSRDSENVIDLLKELSLKGKLIFVVIHQPSSDIYKMFDKMIILDTGGYMAYYGNPVEAVTYFKRSTLQVDSHRGQCELCGNVNPEQIFNIIEANVVDEYGQPTAKRKVTPSQWHQLFREKFNILPAEDIREQPPQSLNIPNRIRQAIIFASRDLQTKLSNKQYLLINLLEAPLLAFILAFIIRYKSAPGGKDYWLRFNDNFPAFILISIIVAIFMGLTVSAEELIRDRKILKRESFLNLSWNSYLLSKISILFTLSAMQTLLFVLIGHTILEIEWRMILPYWFILFTVSSMSNVLGLNISSAFNSAVTIYVLIPLLLIPQMILSGLIFRYDKLNDLVSNKSKVPLVADLMASRWAYEALAVYQFQHNSFEKPFYNLDKLQAQADFNAAFLADELESRRRYIHDHIGNPADSVRQKISQNLKLIQNTIQKEYYQSGTENLMLDKPWTADNYTPAFDRALEEYLTGYKRFYREVYNRAVQNKENLIFQLENAPGTAYRFTDFKNRYYNESLSDLVRNVSAKARIIEHKGELVQKVNPIFRDPSPTHPLQYRSHFLAPTKSFLGMKWSTFWFNACVIWGMAAAFYVALYFEWLRKFIALFGR
jgi:ABC transport system ATP-binding/permease protein